MKCGQISGKISTKTYTFSEILINVLNNSIRTMREMSQHTKVGPAARIDRLLAFNRRLKNSPDSSRHLVDWDLELDPTLIRIPARVLPYPSITFGGDRK